MKPLVIWGCGGHGREIALLAEEIGRPVAGFLDERPHMKGKTVGGLRVLGDIGDVSHLVRDVVVLCAGVGDPELKRRFAARTRAADFVVCPPLIHSAVRVPRCAVISDGSVICAGCVLTVNVRIGAHVIVNRISNVSHDCTVGDYATLSPGCNLAGNVTVGEGAFVGIGATVRERVRIGEWAIVAGGAFVRSDVPPRTMVAGVPAVVKKVITDRTEDRRLDT